MRIVQQSSSAILETDHPLTVREQRRIMAELQAIGIASVILPMGVTVAGLAGCALSEDDADGMEW